MPKVLPSAEDQRIRVSFASRAQLLSSQIAEHRRQLEDTKHSIQSRYQSQLNQIEAELAPAFQARLAVAQQERNFGRYRTITFPNYVARIIGMRRAG